MPKPIHYTELPPSFPGSPRAGEWDVYRREVGRLLAEGHQGKHVLIKGEEILGFFASRGEAVEEGLKRFLLSGFLVHEVQEWEPVIRATAWSY
jgi:hypothetical protein